MELERDVEQYLIRQVEAVGGLCIKHGQDGWPDRIVMLPGGRAIWAEVKRKTGYQSDLQLYRAAELAKVGQVVVCLWSREDVDQLLKK